VTSHDATPERDLKGVRARLAEIGWYHAIDVFPGVTTEGWFDLRHALPLMPFPDVRGKRCLDIGTWDGFYAFEMERRGATEVVAIDVPDLSDMDYPPAIRDDATLDLSQSNNKPRSAGFRLLHELFESKVEWKGLNIYDLTPAIVGTFDVVILGSLLVHLRDPVRALDAARSVLDRDGQFLLVDYVHPPVNLMSRRRPLFELRGEGADFQWWLASNAGLRQALKVSGFEVERASKYFLLRPFRDEREAPYNRGVRAQAKRLTNWVLTGDATHGGHLHRAYLSSRRF
jgi:tRNA (mo5U34)-methyltransferase